MALWMVRAGRHGEYEDRFLSDSRIYLTWDTFNSDIRGVAARSEIVQLLRDQWPDAAEGKIRNHAGQIWAFIKTMTPDDIVVVPSKQKPELHFGVITSEAKYVANAPSDYRLYREVKWIHDVPRSAMEKDILYSFGAIMTICEVRRNDAEARIRHMLKQPPAATSPSSKPARGMEAPEDAGPVDYEQLARDDIANLIIRRFKGHDMERLVEAILRAQGYVTYHSPTGADKGVDILAGSGPLGFASPKICVQVKSEQTPVDHPTLSQLVGTMQAVGAEQGLLVSWSGFKSSVERELPRNFFKVRFWDQKMLLDQLFEHYDRLSEEIRAELPLKRIWTVVADETEER